MPLRWSLLGSYFMKGVVPIWFILGILFRTHEPCYDFASNGLEDFHHPNETTLYYIYIRVYRSRGGGHSTADMVPPLLKIFSLRGHFIFNIQWSIYSNLSGY